MAFSAPSPSVTNASSEELASPCVRNCCLDSNDICVGCGRALEEITGWHAASKSEKLAILARAKERLALKSSKW